MKKVLRKRGQEYLYIFYFKFVSFYQIKNLPGPLSFLFLSGLSPSASKRWKEPVQECSPLQTLDTNLDAGSPAIPFHLQLLGLFDLEEESVLCKERGGENLKEAVSCSALPNLQIWYDDEDDDDDGDDDDCDDDDVSVDVSSLLATSGSIRIPSSWKSPGSSLIPSICSLLPWKCNLQKIAATSQWITCRW